MRFEENIYLNMGLLSKREKGLADYILNHYNEIPLLSIEELAKRGNISSTGITRFVKKIGYSGFVNFKLEIAKDSVGYQEEEKENHMAGDDTPAGIIKRTHIRKNEAIDETYHLLKTEILDKAADILDSAKAIYLFAAGASSIAAMDFQYKLFKINKQVIFPFDIGMQKIAAGGMTKDDVAFIISYNGNTPTLKEIAAIAKSLEVPLISLTANTKNAIKNMADISMVIPELEPIDIRVRLSAISSRDAQMAVIDTLFLTLLFKHTLGK